MGVDADTIANAPLAAEGFAMTPKTIPAIDPLFATAAQSRLDARALGSLRAAAKVLEEGALVNAKPRLDLFAKAGMGTFFDNLQFFFNPDEVNPIFTLLPQEGPPSVTAGAVRFSSPIGFYRAMFTRKWRPLWNVSLTLDLPFRNNRLRGAVVQAEAARTRAEVQERDLAAHHSRKHRQRSRVAEEGGRVDSVRPDRARRAAADRRRRDRAVPDGRPDVVRHVARRGGPDAGSPDAGPALAAIPVGPGAAALRDRHAGLLHGHHGDTRPAAVRSVGVRR